MGGLVAVLVALLVAESFAKTFEDLVAKSVAILLEKVVSSGGKGLKIGWARRWKFG